METVWICDVCEGTITADCGLVEWIVDLSGRGRPGCLQLAHALICSYGANAAMRGVRDMPLDEALGTDGLVRLLALTRVLPTGEVMELVQRLHVPGFEHARLAAREAQREGVFLPTLPQGFYLRDQIKEILKWQATRPGAAQHPRRRQLMRSPRGQSKARAIRRGKSRLAGATVQISVRKP